MLAQRHQGALERFGDGWQLERKLDGLRCIAERHGRHVDLWSRNGLSWRARFGPIAEALDALPATEFVLDGEIVARDDGGRDSFGALQSGRGGAPTLAVFDLLHLLGHDTVDLPLPERRRLLALTVEPAGPQIELVQPLEGDPETLLAQACRDGWEGLVAKRISAPYRGGRSPHWLKLKCVADQELVIGGWSEPSGTRVGLGALLVGFYRDGALVYAGRVGTGFTQAVLADLHQKLSALEIPRSPFSELSQGAKAGLRLDRARGVHWVRPELVAAVGFSEWTPGGMLRHPRYLGLRDDKTATDVVRES
jgi:bifunctional non-homologous end joining protein LigD